MAAHSSWGDVSGQDRAKQAGKPLIGTAAPRLVVKSIDGDDIDLGALYGKKAVYLKFWATWCVPCRAQMPHFEHVYETSGADLAVIAVNTGFNESLEQIRAYRKQLGLTMPIVVDDGRLAKAFKLRVTPQHIVIDRTGRIAFVGHLADDEVNAALLAARTTSGAALATERRAAARTPEPSWNLGDTLPARSLQTVSGGAFRLRDAGSAPRTTALVFLSPWCESYLATSRPEVSKNCRAVREQVTELSQHGAVRFVGIASGLWSDRTDLQKYAVDNHVDIPLSLDADGMWFRSFHVATVPSVIVVTPAGKIVNRIEGDAVREPGALQQALAVGAPVKSTI